MGGPGRGILAAVLHTAGFGIPLAVLASGALGEPRVLAFLAFGALFAGTEAALQKGADRAAGAEAFEAALAAAALLLTFVSALAFRTDGGGGLAATVGAGLAAAGLALRAAAMRALGPRFVSEVRPLPAGDLSTTGLYATLRHPSETGLLALGLGVAILLASPVAVAVWAGLLLPSTLWRIRREERRLARVFGEAWTAYRRSLWRRVARGGPAAA